MCALTVLLHQNLPPPDRMRCITCAPLCVSGIPNSIPPRGDQNRPLTHPGTAVSEEPSREGEAEGPSTLDALAFSRGYTQQQLDDIHAIQQKIQSQLKHRRNFKVDQSRSHSSLNLAAFKKTLTRYGVDISDDESSKLFSFYDKDGMDVRSLIFSQPLHGFHPSSVHFLYALALMLPL